MITVLRKIENNYYMGDDQKPLPNDAFLMLPYLQQLEYATVEDLMDELGIN